jgi:trans-aconitate 2-methyltransferase
VTYEFNGEEYKKASAHQKEWGNRIISGLALKGDEHILDLGCGDGVLTSQLAKLVPDGTVTGIDSSQSMIASACQIQEKNLHFRFLDINMLDYTDAFDIVFSNATLHWVKDHNRLLKNVYRCLRHNGIVRFNFGADGNCIHFMKVIQEAMALPEYSEYFRGFEWPWYMPSVEDYEKLVRRFPF